jgi:hypothetical protein
MGLTLSLVQLQGAGHENNVAKVNIRDEIIRHVESLLQLNKEKQSAKLESQIEQIQSRIDFHEDKINQAVYQLYGLTEEEINIVVGTLLQKC